jgi:hypothetical protein
MIIAQANNGGTPLRQEMELLVECYSDTRKAEFLLNNAIGPDEYTRAVAQVRRMGLDPDAIPHGRPVA